MFAKLKSSSNTSSPSHSGAHALPLSPLEANPISKYYEIGKQIGSAGPELSWKIFTAKSIIDDKEAAVFFFDKKWAERLCKPKRKEVITDVLRAGAQSLDHYCHPKLLSVWHSLEETSESMAFASEPVHGSLANIQGYLEDRLRQGLPSSVREYMFTDFEHIYGILQLTEGLIYLHHTKRIVHRNICPQSVIVNKKGTWKLYGLDFIEKCAEGDLMLPVACQPHTSKLPKMCQPDLDFMAPENQSSSACSPQSDMFSLGLLICSVYNNGRSPIQSNFSTTGFFKQLESLSKTVNEILDRMPIELQESVQAMLEAAPRKRPSSQNLAMLKYFMNPGVHALQYLDVINMKHSSHKANFYYNLRTALPVIPKKMWFQHILPSMETELQGSDVLAAALQPVLAMIDESNMDEYQNVILPIIRNLFLMPKTVQSAALHVVNEVTDELDDDTIKKTILPKARQVLEGNDDVQGHVSAITFIERVIDILDKTEVLDDVLPILLRAQLSEPDVLVPALQIYKQMLTDTRYGLTPNLLASKVMPTLTPVMVSPNIKLDLFASLAELLQEMFAEITRCQQNKLRIESITTDSEKYMRNLDQPTGYPHRPPSLRFQTRRQSISADDVIKKTNTTSNDCSPDINLLSVQANLPYRRHSDNAIQPPRILVAQPSQCGSAGNSRSGSIFNTSPRRRHSYVNPTEIKGLASSIFNPTQATANKSPLPSISPTRASLLMSGRSPPGSRGRRFSVAALSSQTISPPPLRITIDAPSPINPYPPSNHFGLGQDYLSTGDEEPSSRRQSVSNENITKLMRAISPESSPESEPDIQASFLNVMESNMKQRRHSDVAMNVPKIFPATSSTVEDRGCASTASSRAPSPALISRARSSSNLITPNAGRRHSSINPHDIQRFATKMANRAGEAVNEKFEAASKATTKATSGMTLGLDMSMVSGLSPLPSPTAGRRGSRRCSMVDIINDAQSSLLSPQSKKSNKKSKSPSKKLFKKIGSEVNSLLKK